MMENSIGDSLSVIEPCLDLPGALKLHFVDGGFIINHKKTMENSIGDSLCVIESCLDRPGALKLYFVDGGFSYGIYEQDEVERGDEEPVVMNPRVYFCSSSVPDNGYQCRGIFTTHITNSCTLL